VQSAAAANAKEEKEDKNCMKNIISVRYFYIYFFINSILPFWALRALGKYVVRE
jgi:hypothetical protein